MADEEDPKKVGYKVTPIHTRWQKGVSGNPKGREKGHKGLKTDLEAALNARNTLKNNITGKQVKGRNQELAIQRLVERAALGDLKAQALLFPMIMQVLGSRLQEAIEQSGKVPTDDGEVSTAEPDTPSEDEPSDQENDDG
jgi:hypothetical protein